MFGNKCKICGHEFFKNPLLRYKNMPRAAQFLPNRKSIQNEKGVDLEVWQCAACGLVQLSSKPVPYYKSVIRAASFSPEMKTFRLKQFRYFIEKYSLKKRKVIEIGCGQGEYLSLIQKADVDAYGLEYSKELVNHCIKAGLKVSQGFIADANCKLDNGPFNAFFLLSFLEHLPDPGTVLRKISCHLTKDAVGLIEVPNFNMILEKNLFSEFIPDHLFYFTKDTLEETLKLNGFEVVECQNVWHNYIISAVVRKRKKLDLSNFYQFKEKLKNEILGYIDQFGNKKVVIWGAGHQALAMIALADLADKVKYVVDSATFKQGKYTPATHIPIVEPDALNTNCIDAVIVMAASYSDEVVNILQNRFNKSIHIAVLRNFGLEIVE